MKFYRCNECKSIIHFVKESGKPSTCCGNVMQEIVPNTNGAPEKHVPILKHIGNRLFVEVGSTPHPMIDVHYIEWIILETDRGYQQVNLQPGNAPSAEFSLVEGEQIIAAYDYCNIHGLWKS